MFVCGRQSEVGEHQLVMVRLPGMRTLALGEALQQSQALAVDASRSGAGKASLKTLLQMLGLWCCVYDDLRLLLRDPCGQTHFEAELQCCSTLMVEEE